MPLTVRDVDGGRGNIVTGIGQPSEAEVVAALKERLSQDPAKFSKYLYSLIDLSGIVKFSASAPLIRTIADMCINAAKTNNNSFDAVVAPRNSLFGFARMWEVFVDRSGWTTRVFRDVDEAKYWIRESVMERFGIDDLTFA